jgi:DNA-directed RNA polymerase subunit RPC12/RpoP
MADADILEYKCPCCGGAIAFDTSTQKMKCPYCDTEFDLETLKSYDAELSKEKPAAESAAWDTGAQETLSEGVTGYVCNSCGAEIVGDANTAATNCPYCGNPVVLKQNFSGMLRPEAVIPFKLDKKAAKEALLRHYKGKKLLPRQFRDANHLDEIKGVYVPFWLCGCGVDVDARYLGERVRAWSDSSYNYTETSYYLVTRTGSVAFDNVPVDGSKKMPDDMMESLEPFDCAELKDFQTAYLAGFLADRYDVGAEESAARANERIRTSAEAAFAGTVKGYSVLTPDGGVFRFTDPKARYALLPVWLLNTTWNGKPYSFAMNGQTGKFVGNLPIDKKLLWMWMGIYTAAIGGGLFLIDLLIHLL